VFMDWNVIGYDGPGFCQFETSEKLCPTHWKPK
jgi:hypothetical protein